LRLLLATTVGLALAQWAVPHQAWAASVRIALLPLVVHSADSPDYLRAGLADMLSARLQQVDGLDVVVVEDPGSVTNRLSRALEIARPLGVDFVLFGAFTRFGEGASLDVQCAATNAESQSSPLREIFVHSGSIGDVIPDLDELVGKVTRFVVRDFESRDRQAPSLARSPDAENRTALEALRRRVDQLEQEMSAMREAKPKAEPTAPAGPAAEVP